MNERIKELRAKAVMPIQKDGYTSWVFSEEKFAELIIRECIAVHEDDYGVDIIGNVLKKHFGVEL